MPPSGEKERTAGKPPEVEDTKKGASCLSSMGTAEKVFVEVSGAEGFLVVFLEDATAAAEGGVTAASSSAAATSAEKTTTAEKQQRHH